MAIPPATSILNADLVEILAPAHLLAHVARTVDRTAVPVLTIAAGVAVDLEARTAADFVAGIAADRAAEASQEAPGILRHDDNRNIRRGLDTTTPGTVPPQDSQVRLSTTQNLFFIQVRLAAATVFPLARIMADPSSAQRCSGGSSYYPVLQESPFNRTATSAEQKYRVVSAEKKKVAVGASATRKKKPVGRPSKKEVYSKNPSILSSFKPLRTGTTTPLDTSANSESSDDVTQPSRQAQQPTCPPRD
ncbi:hypothetical protein ON010_g1051 [Phytophthora cinnamomi]|nr:hypothetical protein ON010_g1051 [Phytophthora cinnamomi]